MSTVESCTRTQIIPSLHPSPQISLPSPPHPAQVHPYHTRPCKNSSHPIPFPPVQMSIHIFVNNDVTYYSTDDSWTSTVMLDFSLPWKRMSNKLVTDSLLPISSTEVKCVFVSAGIPRDFFHPHGSTATFASTFHCRGNRANSASTSAVHYSPHPVQLCDFN